MTTTRTIESSDLWSAIRGLGMSRMDRAELCELIEAHKENPLFASMVIAEAARQVLASKPQVRYVVNGKRRKYDTLDEAKRQQMRSS